MKYKYKGYEVRIELRTSYIGGSAYWDIDLWKDGNYENLKEFGCETIEEAAEYVNSAYIDYKE